ncbi:protein FAM13A isoform X2 [Lycorma delicatula]
MKRIFSGSILMGRRPSPLKTFGVCLEELPLTNEGIPRVVFRLTTFIEIYGLQIEGLFRLSGGNPKLVERLKASFDRTGDADLESCGDVTSVASLLKVWLKDLPEPVVSEPITAELVTLLHKYKGDSEWCIEARDVLKTLNERNARLLQYILRLLHCYQLRQKDLRTVHNLACVFSPLLLCADSTMPGISTPDTTAATASLITHYAIIYRERLTDHILSGSNSPDVHLFPANAKKSAAIVSEPGKKQRKRKDRQGDLLIAERKFVRSNSEERPCKTGSLEPGIAVDSKDSIRRVSSHEDFSRSRMASRHSAHLMELIAETAANVELSTTVTQPLQERNSSVLFVRSANGNKLRSCNSSNNINNNNNNNNNTTTTNNNNNNNISTDNIASTVKHVLEHAIVPDNILTSTNGTAPGLSCTVGYASELFDENEHERRRHSERFAPQMGPQRTIARRRKKTSSKSQKKYHHSISQSDDLDGGSSSKENEDREEKERIPRLQASLSGDESTGSDTPGSLSRSSSGSSSPSFLQLHSQLQERERSRSPSPHVTASPDHITTSPPLDLSTLHETVDSSEPLRSRDDWSFAHHQPQERLQEVSPRSDSMFASRRIFTASATNVTPALVPPPNHSAIEHHIMDLTKQVQSIKKRLKRYEEGFEREFGYRPSHADKMANPDIKKMCALLSKLRKDLKQLKSEGSSPSSIPRLLHLPCNDKTITIGNVGTKSSTKVISEDVVHDIEKRLNEKRLNAGRISEVDQMTREQLVDEKAMVQRALLQLEGSYGRPTSKEERDLVRPLYDRYRNLKRLLVRSAASKLKDSVSELGTILEHEQMDFSSSSPPPPPPPPPPPLVPTSSSVLSNSLSVSATNSNNLTASNEQRPTTPDMFENLHALPRSELAEQQKTTREEKKRLRRQLREFEDEFQSRTGRKLQKEDRLPMETIYTDYKHVKAKLRLLEALLTKK